MGSKLSPSLVSINTRRNPKVFCRIVSEAQETVVDSKFLIFIYLF
jgi:thioredoxin 1